MKLVYITVTFPYTDGAEAFFAPELAELERLGHEVLLAPRSRNGKLESEAGAFKGRTAPGNLLSPRVLWVSLLELVAHPRVVIRSAWKAIRRGSLQTRVKNALVIPRGVFIGALAKRIQADHIHAQWASTTATIGLLAHEVSGIPWSFTAHRGDIVLSNLFEEKERSAAFVRFISESGVMLSGRLHSKSEGNRQAVIHMGVALPPMAQLPLPRQGRREVLCAANLLPVKGHRHLVEAIGLLRDGGVPCHLTLAGDGFLWIELKLLVVELELGDRVTFLGPVPHTELLARYRRGEVDVFVLPSVDLGGGDHEGIPVALMEAMAHCIPVVATSTGGIPELLKDGAGWMVPPMDSPALAEAIVTLLTDDDQHRRYGERGRLRVEEEFDVAKTTSALLSEMQRAAGGAPTR